MPRGHCPGDGADPVDQGARDRTGPTGYVLNRSRAGQRQFGVSLLHLRIPDRRATAPVRWGRPALLLNSPWSAEDVSLREGDSEAQSSASAATLNTYPQRVNNMDVVQHVSRTFLSPGLVNSTRTGVP